ncbi:4-hydroxybenzoate octaprenyltransferase [Paracraurococcus ruber]|uniref:4-hydroxybenzoate octaprenyltransferase n=1 Tax=Paracraurococcus ruber TaxID=77675 RepID=A0ABS1D217_9PROT|nr:4-hydroxybenzoate octaprenyltransferase [Paracraurococcus ruber]MBK1660665.1 4-hydroxybenzoate polyprenyltransferase [Paracraurococcus ruber]TDG32628.1 4-hydroxybenzoate octaprenyltransferase [Paracraurococcus ruber]
MQGYTDIRTGGLIGRLPAGWRPYALLARLDRPIGSWLLVLPGFWAFAIAAPGWGEGARLALLFGLGAVAMRGAGCVVNDLWDRDIDRRVERTRGRPLASGAVTPFRALVFLAGLCLVGLLVLLQLNRVAILFGLLSLLPILLYPLAKRVTHWPQAMLGLVFSWAAPEGIAAATGQVDLVALLLWAAAFCWILGYDTIYAHQDREDDAAVGIGSTALRFGDRTRPFLAACYAAMLGFLAAAGWAAGLGWAFLPGLLLPAALLARQVALLDIHDPGACLRLFKANREVGLAVALAFLLGRA